MGLSFSSDFRDGQLCRADARVAEVSGSPSQICRAEDVLIGTLSKSSGIATAARFALRKAGAKFRVVSGGFKKMPHEMKEIIRQAASDGGVTCRMLDQPFVYLDKNYVRILGGVEAALEAVAPLGRRTVIQIRGETCLIEQEALKAAGGGAAVVMVDTGQRDHVKRVSKALKDGGLRSRVQIAFSGNLSLEDLDSLVGEDIDAVDIGYAILDAPCLPMRFDVTD
jgi:nicotinate-nucleotide pyrophosphorylase (carboxylating)